MTDFERQSLNDALADLCSTVEQEQERVRQERGRYGRSKDLPSWYVPDVLDSVSVTEYKSEEGVGWEIHAEATNSNGEKYKRVFHCKGPLENRDVEWSRVNEDIA